MTCTEIGPDAHSLPTRRPRVDPRVDPRRAESFGDAELVAFAIDRQDWAGTVLVERYAGLVDSIMWSHRLASADAAEVRQVVWMRLFENLGRIRHTECIAGWIRTVTGNECERTLRKSIQEVPLEDDAVFDFRSGDEIDGGILAHERREVVRQAIVQLPGRGRVLLEALLDDPDLSYEELATKLHMPIGSIGPTRRRSLRELRRVHELAELAGARHQRNH